jgi:DNA-binding PadR family transcriptional regulator
MEREIKKFMLQILLHADGLPVTDDSLRRLARNGFEHVALTAGDLGQWIDDLEAVGLIAGTVDEVFGRMWALTPKGRIKAQQLK